MAVSMLAKKLLTGLVWVVTAAATHGLTLRVKCGATSGLSSVGAALKILQNGVSSGPDTIICTARGAESARFRTGPGPTDAIQTQRLLICRHAEACDSGQFGGLHLHNRKRRVLGRCPELC